MTDLGDAASLGRFLTLADTAEVLNVSVNQAYSLVRSGELPAIKVGGSGHWRIERSMLEDYIAAKYEEARRINLWQQSDWTGGPELLFERPAARQGGAARGGDSQGGDSQGGDSQGRNSQGGNSQSGASPTGSVQAD